jgi:hypothetical protein
MVRQKVLSFSVLAERSKYGQRGHSRIRLTPWNTSFSARNIRSELGFYLVAGCSPRDISRMERFQNGDQGKGSFCPLNYRGVFSACVRAGSGTVATSCAAGASARSSAWAAGKAPNGRTATGSDGAEIRSRHESSGPRGHAWALKLARPQAWSQAPPSPSRIPQWTERSSVPRRNGHAWRARRADGFSARRRSR